MAYRNMLLSVQYNTSLNKKNKVSISANKDQSLSYWVRECCKCRQLCVL